jgi:AhpD family alkylhydroperoxidase
MEPRIENPAITVQGAMPALQRLSVAAKSTGVPTSVLHLIEVRASQINGCAVCLDLHTREMKLAGEPDERINMVAAWREAPYYTDAERAALALTESMTRLADSSDPVPDEIWEDAASHFDERQLGGLVLGIAGINTWNRINAATRQITGDWVEQWVHQPEPVAST